ALQRRPRRLERRELPLPVQLQQLGCRKCAQIAVQAFSPCMSQVPPSDAGRVTALLLTSRPAALQRAAKAEGSLKARPMAARAGAGGTFPSRAASAFLEPRTIFPRARSRRTRSPS